MGAWEVGKRVPPVRVRSATLALPPARVIRLASAPSCDKRTPWHPLHARHRALRRAIRRAHRQCARRHYKPAPPPRWRCCPRGGGGSAATCGVICGNQHRRSPSRRRRLPGAGTTAHANQRRPPHHACRAPHARRVGVRSGKIRAGMQVSPLGPPQAPHARRSGVRPGKCLSAAQETGGHGRTRARAACGGQRTWVGGSDCAGAGAEQNIPMAACLTHVGQLDAHPPSPKISWTSAQSAHLENVSYCSDV